MAGEISLSFNVDRCDPAPWDCEVVTVAWSGQPADSWDELELVDNDNREIDLLDDLDEWVVD